MRYAILCTYPSGQQRLVSTFLEDDKDNISDEYMECLQGCNPHNYYEIVGVTLSFLKEANGNTLQQEQRLKFLSQMDMEFQRAYITHKWCDELEHETYDFTFFYLGGHEL